MRKIFEPFLEWLASMFDIKAEYGLTIPQIADLVRLANQGEEGRDRAERLACSGFGLRTSEFYKLMDSYGISCK